MLNLSLVRFYLRHSGATSGQEILHDVFACGDLGAREIVAFCLGLRANPRSRRSLRTVGQHWRLLRGDPTEHEPVWYSSLAEHVLAMFRQWRLMAYPTTPAIPDETLTERLPRNLRRRLRATGMVQVELPTLYARAQEAIRETWAMLQQGSAVLWIDNWYMERYGSNPEAPDQSLDVTVMAVLPISTTADPPALATRSHRVPDFPGHVSLLHMVVRLDNEDSSIIQSTRTFLIKVNRLARTPLSGADIRVPLDVARERRRTLQWRPLAHSDERVSANVEFLRLLQDVHTVRNHTGGSLPLLVDEKVHYTLCRLMYSPGMRGHDVLRWLRQIPLLYGVWHPYKQCVSLVYRRFFPLFAVLECTGSPPTVGEVRCYRKLVYMEKMCAALLLAAHPLRQLVEGALRQATSHIVRLIVHPHNLPSTPSLAQGNTQQNVMCI